MIGEGSCQPHPWASGVKLGMGAWFVLRGPSGGWVPSPLLESARTKLGRISDFACILVYSGVRQAAGETISVP